MTAVLEPATGTATARRIHILGGPGSGKTTLATRIAARTHIPVHNLDDVATVGHERRPRSEAERAGMVDEILRADAWITEGVQLGWTDPLLAAADLVVWLDAVSMPRASRRIVRRFVAGAVTELQRRPMRERFTRFGDYGRQLRSLGGAMRETRGYYASGPGGSAASADGDAVAGPGADQAAPDALAADGTPRSRHQTEAALAPYRHKLVRCGSAAEIAALVARFA